MNSLTFSVPSGIDTRNYTLSLLSHASAGGLISRQRQAEIRDALDRQFCALAERFTKRESSSLSERVAEMLYRSLLYTCDIFLLGMSFSDGLKTVCTADLGDIYKGGVELNLRYYDLSREVFRKAYAARLDVKMPEYRYIFEHSFDEFYLHYDGAFNAQDCLAAIDYPLLYGNELGCGGALYMLKYFSGILAENRLCQSFPMDKINEILRHEMDVYSCAETDLYVNISECVLKNYLDVNLPQEATLSEEALRQGGEKLISARFVPYFLGYAREYACRKFRQA